MGNEVSGEEKQEKTILRSPNVGEASDLYWASRGGDVDAVRQILAMTTFNDLNCLEPNGSTALHAASFFGHADVVRVLLQERGVMRHRKNRHGLTAYEEAANDEIRQLFHRPDSDRFCTNSTGDNEVIFNCTTDQPTEECVDDDDEVDATWVKTFDTDLQVKAMKSIMQLCKTVISSSLLMRIVTRLARGKDGPEVLDLVDEATNTLREYINEYVESTHPEYDKACELLSKYAKTKDPGHLLRLYSLETPFYRHLGSTGNAKTLVDLVMRQLTSLKARAFRGRTFRGLSMTTKDFKAYRWAFKRKGSIIWTKNFCSTSVDEAVARRFVPTPCDEKLSVLMIFDFPESCDMAIQLYALSNALPCISDFEDEREVLMFPYTMFHVTNITNENSNNEYTIHLENVLPKFDLMAFISAINSGDTAVVDDHFE